MTGGPVVFQTGGLGQLDQPRAGARILLRVRLRLLDEWAANDCGIEWRDNLDAALGVVDFCLSQCWGKR